MEWFIISRDMHVLCNPSTDAEYSLPIDDSGVNYGQRITLANNVAIGTYDFKTFPDHEDSKYITEGNYIAFKDNMAKTDCIRLCLSRGMKNGTYTAKT